MVILRCRQCGSEVASDEKRKKCPECGELFPFECAVCGKHLRPPIPHFPVEKYFTDDNRPLCQDHYQRQCPECSKWFRADENPGYYMCSSCTAKRESAVADAGDSDAEERTASGGGKPGCFAMLTLCIGSSLLLLTCASVLLR